MEARQTGSGNKAQQSNELSEELCQKQENSRALRSSVQPWQLSTWAAWCEPEVTSVMQELLVEAMPCALQEVRAALVALDVCIWITNYNNHSSVACLFCFCHGILSSGHRRDF